MSNRAGKAMKREMEEIKQFFLNSEEHSEEAIKHFCDFRDIRFEIYQLLYHDFITPKEANEIGEIWLKLEKGEDY